MTCDHAQELISAQMDREFDGAQGPQLKEHLQACPACRATALDLRLLDGKLRLAFSSCADSSTAVQERAIREIRSAAPATMPIQKVAGARSTGHAFDRASPAKRWGFVVGVAASMGALFLLVQHFFPRQGVQPVAENTLPTLEFLVPAPRAPVPETKPADVGATVTTTDGRRRVLLPDHSVVYLNRDTEVLVEADRTLRLKRGEIFVEVSPRTPPALPSHGGDTGGATFVVHTPKRDVSALGTKFSVQAGEKGTGVVVTQGKVKVSDLNDLVAAGQQLEVGASAASLAPRASHLLDWTRELMIASESPLVPASTYTGGALVAVDSNGQQAKLKLRKYHVDVHIEDGFARTTIDQTYFNHAPSRLEGTFYFPLPADASLSRLAMYVDGKLMEGGMAERDYARGVYEEIVHSQKDPALLEWLDGSTFKMRVFPLEAFQEKRIVLSYTQRLSTLYDETTYRFPAGHNLGTVEQWSFESRVKGGASVAWTSDSHELKSRTEGNDLLLETNAKKVKLDRDVTLRLHDPALAMAAQSVARFSTIRHNGEHFLMVRYRPQLPAAQPKTVRPPRTWVFLYESSGDRDPLVARTQTEVVRTILENVEHQDRFVVLTAGTRVLASNTDLLNASPEHVREAIAFLDKSHLVGALDLGKALATAAPYLQQTPESFLVHVGTGIAALGERQDNKLIEKLPANAKYVGVAVGRRWSRPFMKSAADRTGGFFTQINPDEPAAWRAFDLHATLNTPRLLDIKVHDGDTGSMFHGHANSLSQGEEMCAVARIRPEVDRLPKTLMVRGLIDGQPFERELEVRDVVDGASYLPRTWAKLELDHLVANPGSDEAKAKKEIVELSKAMYVMTKYTSLLVLENEEMYERFKVDKGRKDHWAMYRCPDKIDVVYDPPAGYRDRFSPKTIKPHANEIRSTIVTRGVAHALVWPRAETGVVEFEKHHLHKSWGVHARLGIAGGEGDGDGNSETLALKGYLSPSRRSVLRLREMQDKADTSRFRRLTSGKSRDFAKSPAERPVEHELRELARKKSVEDLESSLKDMKEVKLDQYSAFVETQPALYSRPYFNNDDRLFSDLLAYAPGMDTSEADIKAVVEAEAMPSIGSLLGKIDDESRRLIDKARSFGWKSATMTLDGTKDVRVTFDGQGRFAYERVLDNDLTERVVCDGTTLWHLYPELGVGAKRPVSRFHRIAWSREMPWVLPMAEDLARGADLVSLDARTVAILPHADDDHPRTYEWHLVFAADGRLAERRLVEKPSDKVRYREIHDSLGVVRGVDESNKDNTGRSWNDKIESTDAPDLRPKTDDLVVLPMPWRSSGHVLQDVRHWHWFGDRALNHEEAMRLFASFVVEGNGPRARQIFETCIVPRGLHKRGHFALLAASGQTVAGMPSFLAMFQQQPKVALLRYLALHDNSPYHLIHMYKPISLGANVAPEGTFFHRLASFRDLRATWLQSRRPRTKADLERALAFARRYHDSVLGWAMMDVLQQRVRNDKEMSRLLAETYKLFADFEELAYFARYEQARNLLKSGQREAARKTFRDLFQDAIAKDRLPALDHDFVTALSRSEKEETDLWSDLIGQTSHQLTGRGRWTACVWLAWQCWQLGDQPLANQVLAQAMQVPDKDAKHLATCRVAVNFLRSTGQFDRAEVLLKDLLDRPEYAKIADLWRLSSKNAESRGMTEQSMVALEKALDLEFRAMTGQVDLSQLRSDYGRLLGHYQWLARAAKAVHAPMPADLLPRTIRAADRWRSLDPEARQACDAAAEILKLLDEKELAWEYLTTPLGVQPHESSSWWQLAGNLRREGRLDLADLAYDAAYQADPINAQILWDRAESLKAGGKQAEAQKVMRQIADGQWHIRFAFIQSQARSQLQGR